MSNDALIGMAIGVSIGTYISFLITWFFLDKRVRKIEMLIARAKLVRWTDIKEELQDGQ